MVVVDVARAICGHSVGDPQEALGASISATRHPAALSGDKREGGDYCLVLMAKWPYSTARWQKLRDQQLRAEPLCAKCDQPTPAEVVDHITPHRGNADLAFDVGNLQSLCASHHARRKQMEERHGYDPSVGSDGWPSDRNHPANRTRGRPRDLPS